MYSLGSQTGITQGYRTQLMDSANWDSSWGFLALFTGPVPATHQDAPFDTSDPKQIFANMEAGLDFNASLMRDDNTRMRLMANQGRTFKPSCLPYLEQQYDKWSYMPRVQMMEWAYNDLYVNTFDNMYAAQNGSINNFPAVLTRNYYLNAGYHGLRYLWTKHRIRDLGQRDLNSYDFYSYYGNGNRNIGNIWPLVLEFDEVITVDSLEYYRGWFSGNGNSAAEVIIDYWDDSANEGAGDWVEHETVALVESGSETPIQFTELVTEIAAQKFRLRFGDTASSTFHFAWIRLMSSTPPAVVTQTTVDFTWGLVLPYADNMYRFDEFKGYADWGFDNNTGGMVMINDKIHPQTQKIPSLLVDVGGPHGTETVKLKKAIGVQQGEVPELLNFIVEFID